LTSAETRAILAGQLPHPDRPARGLNLFLAKSIIEAHGGTLTIKSSTGEGAEFTFTLPTAPSRATAKDNLSARKSSAPTKHAPEADPS
jgi:hypothetical protein